MTKNELRKIYLEKRKTLAPEEIKQKSLQITEIFFQSFDLRRINFLHCFLPIKKFNEIDTRIIFERVWREFPQIETLVPRVNFQTNEIENLTFTARTELVRNNWQILEPTHNESIASERIDAVLVPLLCFDSHGFRVGYGKGFYDKLLATCRTDCLKIGLSFFPPLENIADVNEFDIKLDFCVTPEDLVDSWQRQLAV